MTEPATSRTPLNQSLLRVTLLAVLAGSVVFLLVTLLTLLTGSGNCLSSWRELPSCRETLNRLVAPGPHEATLAAIAATLAAGAYVLAIRPLHTFVSLPARYVRFAEPVLFILLGCLLAAALDPAVSDFLRFLGMALLVAVIWYAAKGAASAFHTIDTALPEASGRQPGQTLSTYALLVLPLAFLCAGGISRFAVQPEIPAIPISLIYAVLLVAVVDALMLLLYVRNTVRQHEWQLRRAHIDHSLHPRTARLAAWTLALAAIAGFGVPVTSLVAALVSPVPPAGHAVVDLLSRLANPNPTAKKCTKHCRRGGGTHQTTKTGAGKAHKVPHTTDWFALILHGVAIAVLAALLLTIVWQWRTDTVRTRSARGPPSPLAFLRRFWQALLAHFRRAGRTLADFLPSSLVDPGGGLRLPGVLRGAHRGLSPREQIQRYYADAVQNASRHGIARPPAQTPAAYLPRLEASLPESGDAAAALTAAYVEARYSPHAIDEERAGMARRHWRRLRIAVRHASRAGKADNST